MPDNIENDTTETEEVKVEHEAEPVTETPPDKADTEEDKEAAKLEKLAASFIEHLVPEAYRDAVPKGLEPMERVEWAKSVSKMGLFDGKRTQDGPDTKRPNPSINKGQGGESAYQAYYKNL